MHYPPVNFYYVFVTKINIQSKFVYNSTSTCIKNHISTNIGFDNYIIK